MTSSRHRRRTSPQVMRRRVTLAVVVLMTIALLSLLFTGGGRSPSTTTTSTSAPTTTSAPAPTTTTTTIDPGTLPQTSEEPPTDASALQARLAPLWTAIQQNSLTIGETVFFPESAYVQIKTGQIPNPQSDYQSRLIAFYALDLPAYQQALGGTPNRATLTGVNVNASYATWIAPGTCENSIGYWHLPNIRLVYSINGAVSSFGVASLISWRGVWYVVHLGPNPRPSNIGTVDQPSSGAGTPGPPGGC